jgi:hypothetical protein
MKKIILFLSFAITVLSVSSQSITVTSPNGSEVWAGCTQQTITWNSSGVTHYNIDYSTDNGATWTSVASIMSIPSNQFVWTVPNISSTSCLVRVQDAYNLTVFDVSNVTFSITPSVVVTSPNGAESWEAGTVQTITWVHSGTSNYFDLHYSVDAGTSWNVIQTNYYSTTGQYTWNVPNTPSSTCLVRVRDKNNATCMVDISDQLFTIAPGTPVITVTSPNTNVTRYVGNTYNITWTSQYVTSNAMKIDYSIDNGVNWIPVAANTPNTGSYSWLVPNTPSTQCLVKVTDLGNPSTNDVSNTTFTIALPWITVTSPNGGETFGSCSSRSITWSHAGTSGQFRVQYSTDNGTSWTTLTNSTTASSYTWNPVPSISSSNSLVKVFDVNNHAYRDSSDAVFAIVPNSDIIISSPNGGELWEAGTNKTITWVSAPNSYRFSVAYSLNNGSTWTTITSSTYSSSHSWLVPNDPTNQALIRVRDYDNSCIQDFSDAVFTITPPTPVISVTNPNTAVTRYIGQTNNITWTSAYLTSNFVTIEYTYDNGNTWHIIESVTENDGSYPWTTPNTPSAQCRVRISEYGNPAVFDESNVNFTIAHPWITVTSPNGGETWKGCTPGTITWSSAGTSGSFRIYYSLNNGASWTSITTSSSSSYSWSNVIDMPSTQALIKVADNNNLTLADSSDAVFTILKNNDIVIISPTAAKAGKWGLRKIFRGSVNPQPTGMLYIIPQTTELHGARSRLQPIQHPKAGLYQTNHQTRL